MTAGSSTVGKENPSSSGTDAEMDHFLITALLSLVLQASALANQLLLFVVKYITTGVGRGNVATDLRFKTLMFCKNTDLPDAKMQLNLSCTAALSQVICFLIYLS